MAYRFHCALQLRTLPEQNCTIRGLDNTEYFLVNGVLEGTVYQLGRNGQRSVVCLLQDISYDLNDQRSILVSYCDGCLEYHEFIDAVPPNIRTERYSGECKGQEFLLHKNHELVQEGSVFRDVLKQACLECEGVRYPIQVDRDARHRITALSVYKPLRWGNDSNMPLARIIYTDSRHCDIWMESLPSALLCAAVWSLAISV